MADFVDASAASAGATDYLTVATFKSANVHLDLSDFTDATISGLVTRASRWVDGQCNQSLQLEDITGEKIKGWVNPRGDLELWTMKFPVDHVDSLKIVLGTTTMTLDLVDDSGDKRYDVPSNSAPPVLYPGDEFSLVSTGRLITLQGQDWYFLVDYRAGHATIPQAVQDATGLYVKHLMAERFKQAGAATLRQGLVSMGWGRDDLFVQEAREMLLPYTRTWSA